MIKIYTAPSCLGCRKVKKYFKEHNIQYVEKSIINTRLSREDIYKMLMKSENGFDDIISTRSKVFKEKNADIDQMNLSQLVDFIIENPTVLKRPIIIGDYEALFKIIRDNEKEKEELNEQIVELKQQIRNLKTSIEIAKGASDNDTLGATNTNLDVMKRLAQLEKIVYGKDE